MATPEDIEWKLKVSTQLGAIEATLSRVEEQTTATNGRVSELERLNAVALAEKGSRHTNWGIFWALVGSAIGAIVILFTHK